MKLGGIMITLLNKFDDNYVMKEKDILDVASSYISANNLEPFLSDVVFDPNSGHLGHYNLKVCNKVFMLYKNFQSSPILEPD